MFTFVSSVLASTLRGWKGTMSMVRTEQPEKPIFLYDIEGCPYCRPVREQLTELDLDVIIVPCPKGSTEHWQALQERGGKKQVPFLVDENTGTQLYESRDIITYLKDTYGDDERKQVIHSPSRSTSKMASGLRFGAGLKYQTSQTPESLLELYSFESSPFARLVRETLAEMGIPYVLRNCGKQQTSDLGVPWLRPTMSTYQPIEGTKRYELKDRTGKVQIPYLFDPNNDKGLFESKDIIRYLKSTYAA